MKKNLHILLMLLVCLLTNSLYGQRYPDRRYIRSGNEEYERQNFVESEVAYRRALEKVPGSYEAIFNLGNALYKQGNFAEAEKAFGQVAADTSRMDQVAQSYYNTGNALFKQRKLEQALEAYKNALRLNPNDQEAKFNLAYTKKLLEKDKNGGGGNNQNQNNNNDQNQNNNNNQNQNRNQNQQNQNGQDGQNDQQQGKPDQQQGQNPQQGGMSKEEADRMLDAVQMSEDKTREKQNAQKAKVVKSSKKNW